MMNPVDLHLRLNNPKNIWWMNIGVEEIWCKGEVGLLPKLKNNDEKKLIHQTEQLCLLMAKKEDIVITRHGVSEIVKHSLITAGIELPEVWIIDKKSEESKTISEIILNDNKMIEDIKRLGNINLIPYAVSPIEELIAIKTCGNLFGSNSEITKRINSKVNARNLAEDIGLRVTEGSICNSVSEVINTVEKLRKNSCNKVVIKDEFGASGKGLFIIDSHKTKELFYMIMRRKNIEKERINVVVERWYEDSMDINYQVIIYDDGNIDYIEPKKQIIHNLVYMGSEFPLDPYLWKEQLGQYEQYAIIIGQKLWEIGYRGIASIDSIITKEGKIYPIIEINGRFSLSTYLSYLPRIFGEDKLYKSVYYNVTRKKFMIIYQNINRYQYTPEKGEGVLLYSFGEGENDKVRFFLLFIAENKDRIRLLEDGIYQRNM